MHTEEPIFFNPNASKMAKNVVVMGFTTIWDDLTRSEIARGTELEVPKRPDNGRGDTELIGPYALRGAITLQS